MTDLHSGDQREDTAARGAATVGDLWRQVTDGVLGALRDAVRDGLGRPGPKIAYRTLKRRLVALLSEARRQSTQLITGHLRRTAESMFGGRRPAPPRPVTDGIERQLDSVQVQVFRTVDDVFRRVVVQAMRARAVTTDAARLRAAQEILDDLADHGVTVFVDRVGRRWELVSYVEMATRTAMSRALLNMQLTAYTGRGYDAVLVVSRTLEVPCPRCRPYDGRVISITGATAGQTLTATPKGAPARTERVVATLPEAMAAGFLHPNCRHGLVPFIDGQVMTPVGRTLLPRPVYDAEQRQRALERAVRSARRRHAVALDPGTYAATRRAVAAAQRAAREHAAQHGIPRRRRRERIDVPR